MKVFGGHNETFTICTSQTITFAKTDFFYKYQYQIIEMGIFWVLDSVPYVQLNSYDHMSTESCLKSHLKDWRSKLTTLILQIKCGINAS